MPVLIGLFLTGGTRGIGKALAEAFLRSGWSVTLTGRNPENAEMVAGLL
jgi:NAD(P)-dependent dehydrogenase (short-subunit alcohol dehydrogenase family)